MKRLLVISIITFIMMASAVNAFDGKRRGFVLGGGAGVAAVAHWSVDVDFFGLDRASYDEDRVGVGFNLIIGGAFDEHNMLVYEGNVAGFNSGLFDESTAQGFNGAVWYHYFGAVGRTAFTAVGLGAYYFEVGDYDATDPGGALLFGGGYEFDPHWQVGIYLTFGKTSDEAYGIKGNFEHANLSVLVSGIAF